MQPSEYEIQREVEALRDLRRRSSTPGGLAIDPDLPSSDAVDGADRSTTEQAEDPLHLFWVPADVHPEIAPAEFRAFIKEHATTGLQRAPSQSGSSSGLGRKKSMLSRQYKPSENDGVEDEHVTPLRRNRSSVYSQGPQLTINDLQKLEELAEEASESPDPTRLKTLLRRSLSLNVSPTAVDQLENVTDLGDEADAPIFVPPPGQIIRRAARTKIRKPSLPGDGGGHRFGASRRGPRSQTVASPLERRASDVSSSEHSESLESLSAPMLRPRAISNDGIVQERPESFSDVYDAYATDEEEPPSAPLVVTAPTTSVPLAPEQSPLAPQQPLSEEPQVQPDLLEALGPVIHQPQPQHLLSPYASGSSDQRSPSRSPSPSSEISPPPSADPHSPPFTSPGHSPSSSVSSSRKDKDKKGLFGKWGGDKGGKKGHKEKEKEKEKEREGRSLDKDRDSGFFGSLFGGKSKKHEEHTPVTSGAGREAAQALLGVSKSRSRAPSPAPPGSPMAGGDNWSRFPIHVERAIYRLSHIKLANPRRPLYEQVCISNLMFWYLGVINKTSTPGSPAANSAPQTPSPQTEEEAEREKERKEVEAREKAEQQQREAEEREREAMKKKESGKRGSLTKTPPGGGGRRNEMPIKGPSYSMQHQVMEQEYSGFQSGSNRPSSAPIPIGSNQSYQHSRGQQRQYSQYNNSPPQLSTPQSQPQMQLPDHFFYSSEQQQQQPQQRATLPPGAMAPVDTSNWMSQSSKKHNSSPPLSPGSKRSRSPPSAGSGPYDVPGGGRLPGRSISATAVMPSSSPPRHQANGKPRKGASAHAVPATGGRRHQQQWAADDMQNGVSMQGEEEDVPLAVWQQQRRR